MSQRKPELLPSDETDDSQLSLLSTAPLDSPGAASSAQAATATPTPRESLAGSQPGDRRITFEQVVLGVIGLMIALVLVLAMWLTYLRIDHINDQKAFDQTLISTLDIVTDDAAGSDTAADPAPAPALADVRAEAKAVLAEAQRINARSEDAQNTVNLVLSFLEGAAVLVGIAIGAAAYFGFRNAREISEDAHNDHEKTLRIQEELAVALAGLNDRQQKLDRALAELGDSRAKVEYAQEIPSLLTMAYQELRLGNYEQAYIPALRVLKLHADNIQALYLAGWLENQYIPGKANDALLRLERAVELDPNWPSARAALAVVQRRRAKDASGEDQRRLYNEAERNFRRALIDNPNLLDLNLESFNGPLAAIYRERGEYDKARDTYRAACQVTPGSSYPAGNLATLLLRDHTLNEAALAPAIKMYQRTVHLATAELGPVRRDYFIQMDIAMSTLMLSGAQVKGYTLDDAREKFYEAIDSNDPSVEMLKVTRRGLEALNEACPPDWAGAKALLAELLEDIKQRIGETPTTAPILPGTGPSTAASTESV